MPRLDFMRRALEERQERLEREVQELRQEFERFRHNVERIASPSIVSEQEPHREANDLTAWVEAQLERLMEVRRSAGGHNQQANHTPPKPEPVGVAGIEGDEPVRE